MTKALNHNRDIAILLLLMAITLFTCSLTILDEGLASIISLLGMLMGSCGMGFAGAHIWLAKKQIERA